MPGALNIKNAEAVELAKQLAARTGESITDAVTNALRQRLDVLAHEEDAAVLIIEVGRIQSLVASLPELDARGADEIIGYDDFGLPR